MKQKVFAIFVILILLVAALPAVTAGAANGVQAVPVDISHRLKGETAPAQPYVDANHLPSGGSTTDSQCSTGTGEFITIVIPSFDAANPELQEVVFWKESVGDSATLWVAWDYLVTHYGRQDVITCDQLAYLQGSMDSIVETDVYYFGDYKPRPYHPSAKKNNTNIDVMIYNIADESFYDSEFPFYIAGFFWSSINEAFNRNMIFIDSLDWGNRLGPNSSPWRGSDSSLWRENLYEGTVAHELEHLIHNDHDIDEDSWIDEGMADLAEYLNGFGHPDGHVVYYLAFHRTPLTIWGGGLEDYGASYLFQLYMLENFGTKDGSSFTGWSNTWTRNLMDQQANSIAGVEAASGANFNDLFDSWMVANYLDNPGQMGAGGFPVGYNEIDLAPYNSPSYGSWSIGRAIEDIYNGDHHGNLPVDRYYGGYISSSVEYPVGAVQPYTAIYGAYSGIAPEMGIYFRGAAQSGIAPNSGSYEAASGGGHLLSDRMLELNTPIGGTLTFATWFDIEEEWDYGFVEVSTDNGPWTPLAGSITATSINPNQSTAWANSLVGGQASTDTVITGNSGGWVTATFSLPAGSNQVRFSYYTDEAVNGQGWFIDDVAVGGISDGFELGSGNWDLGGWTITTGLFDNDWMAGYINPVYNKRNKLLSIDWDYLTGGFSGAYEILTGVVDTSRLNNDAAVVFFANRPYDNPFESGYLILVQKGNAAP